MSSAVLRVTPEPQRRPTRRRISLDLLSPVFNVGRYIRVEHVLRHLKIAPLDRQVFNPFHELLRGDRSRCEIGRPVRRAAGKNRLAPVIYEYLGELHGSPPKSRGIYPSIWRASIHRQLSGRNHGAGGLRVDLTHPYPWGPAKGLMRATPKGSKSSTLRVTTVRPRTRAVAAMSASSRW